MNGLSLYFRQNQGIKLLLGISYYCESVNQSFEDTDKFNREKLQISQSKPCHSQFSIVIQSIVTDFYKRNIEVFDHLDTYSSESISLDSHLLHKSNPGAENQK